MHGYWKCQVYLAILGAKSGVLLIYEIMASNFHFIRYNVGVVYAKNREAI
jgi:hypothetical protein